MRGVAGSMLKEFKYFNKNKKILVLEVEEATLPKLSNILKPDMIVITNLFRDQLDAYGDIDTTKAYFETAIKNMSPSGTVILNGQDPKLDSLALVSKVKILRFGLELESFSTKFEGEKAVSTLDLLIRKKQGIITVNENYTIPKLALTGNYNLYNLAAALLVAKELGVDYSNACNHVSNFTNVFGRGEVIKHNNTNITLHLIKNPAGAELVIDSLPKLTDQDMVIWAMNDNTADGKDVSWFWDIDMEKNASNLKLANIFVSGSRKEDILVRLKMALGTVSIQPFEIKDAWETITHTPAKNVFILATYTAILSIRKVLASKVTLANIDDEKF
jgi:lipid II isoglutaminyl synthase (glutamine-hydrolysing)